MSRLVVTVRSLEVEAERWEQDLGDWHEAVGRGVLIGGSADCDVQLASEPKALVAVFFAMSNHQFVATLEAPITPAEYDGERPRPERVDDRRFHMGGYELRFGTAPSAAWPAIDQPILIGEPLDDHTTPIQQPPEPADAPRGRSAAIFAYLLVGALLAAAVVRVMSR